MASDFVFPYMAAAKGGIGDYVESPWRIVLHTTEVNARPSLWIPSFQYPSHVVASFEHNEIFQLIGFNEAAAALYHYSGQTETNRMGAIQIEINGRADEAGSWSQEKLKWIGEKILKPICDWIDANGGGFDCNNIPAPGAHGGSASEDAPQRLTNAEWAVFNGICGHRHVPQNDHYDPDQLDVPAIVRYANAGEMTVTYTMRDDRIDLVGVNADGHIYHKWYDGTGWLPGKVSDVGGWEWVTVNVKGDALAAGNSIDTAWYGEQFHIFYVRKDGQAGHLFVGPGTNGWVTEVIAGGVVGVSTATRTKLESK